MSDKKTSGVPPTMLLGYRTILFSRITVAMMLLLGCFTVTSQAAEGKPNVVILFIDDLNFADIKDVYDFGRFPAPWRYGHDAPYAQPVRKSPVMVSPNLDRLAQNAVIFDRFYVTSSVCTPSRYSLLTGQYASQAYSLEREKWEPGQSVHRVGFNTHIHRDQYTMPGLFRSAGYTTGIVGKLHCHDANEQEIIQTYKKYNKQERLSPEALAEIKANYLKFVNIIRRDYAWDSVERVYNGNADAHFTPRQLRYFNMDWCTEAALDFIEANKSKPFFLYYAINLPHGVNTPGHMQAMKNLASPMGPLKKAPGVIPTVDEICRRIEEAGGDPDNSAAPTMIDAVLGVVDEKLKEAGVYDNTILVFLSDHQALGKQHVYEGSRVPCLIRWPAKVKRTIRSDALLANIDLLPTFAEIVGGTLSEDVVVDGRSFAPLLLGDASFPGRESLMLEMEYGRALVAGEYKYIEFFVPEAVRQQVANRATRQDKRGNTVRVGWQWNLRQAPQMFPHYFEPVQLYDLAKDPLESHNLIGNPEHATVAKRMRKELMPLIERCKEVQAAAAKEYQP